MSVAELVGLDVYLRHTNTKGESYVQQHRCWDKERFIASQQAAAEKLNADAKTGEPRKAKVEQITEDQYRKEQKK